MVELIVVALGLSFEESLVGQLEIDPLLLNQRENIQLARAPSQTLGREKEGMPMYAINWVKANIVPVEDREARAAKPPNQFRFWEMYSERAGRGKVIPPQIVTAA